MVERFSILLSRVMSDYGVGGARLEEILKEHGVDNITFRRISEYLRNVSTPPFDKARAIMDVMGFPINDEELKESLDFNRELIREEREDEEFMRGYSKYIKAKIRLKNIEVRKGDTPTQTERVLKDRIAQLYGNENNLSVYIEQLIREDLNKNIIGEDDII